MPRDPQPGASQLNISRDWRHSEVFYAAKINEKFRETIMSYSFVSSVAILTLFPLASDSDFRLLVHSVRTRYAAYDIRMWKRLIEHLWSGVVRYTVTDYVQGTQDKVSDMRARRGLGLSALHNTPTRLRK